MIYYFIMGNHIYFPKLLDRNGMENYIYFGDVYFREGTDCNSDLPVRGA